jgi:hypothetical protein
MTRHIRHIAPWILLFGYLAAGVAGECTHHDPHNIRLASHPVVASHDCGPHERHLPPENGKHCLACSQSASRVAVPTSLIPPAVPVVVGCRAEIPSHTIPQISFYFSSGKRGPPVA